MADRSTEPDKDERTQYIRADDQRRQKRADRLFHWSLDMPPADDDMDVRVNKSSGMTWKEMAVIAAAGLGGGWLFMQASKAPEPNPPAATQQGEPLRGTIRFWADDGTEIQEATSG